ncbi:hypothetical protein PRIPAC_86751 [Pristionchus pacificus]|uniref:Ribosomal protein n=1 Tax=Pristionchus pacificus TaxID=54126 RepID=A0A2A6BIF2_PRIPA|nr:hypothetical protein PRIPAC_86751 [Pristionchus pacificus]|eukprot:PDM65606.1 ribosomal protein [Pristionchus pacificus]
MHILTKLRKTFFCEQSCQFVLTLAGVNTFRNSYANSSGSVIRKALKSLEVLKWVDKSENGKGRILSKQGRKDLDRIAADHLRRDERGGRTRHAFQKQRNLENYKI